MSAPPLPAGGSQEYLWWKRGAEDEHAAINEGLPRWVQDLRDLLPGLYRCWKNQQTARPVTSERELVLGLARIYCPDELRDNAEPAARRPAACESCGRHTETCRHCGKPIEQVRNSDDDGWIWDHVGMGYLCPVNRQHAEPRPALCGSGTSLAKAGSGSTRTPAPYRCSWRSAVTGAT